ncbi:MAG: hypothetical protein ACI9R3_002628 [Verrucomicrobiales bacterium]|jgi:hypothetical protein
MRKPRKSSQNIIGILPAAAASVTVGVCYCVLNINDSRDKVEDPALTSAGFLATQSVETFSRQEKRRHGRGSQSELRVRLPDPSKLAAHGQQAEPLFADRRLHEISQHVWKTPERSGNGWNFLTSGLRQEIDAAKAESKRWDGIDLHHSSTRGGNAAMLAMYHKVRGLEGGLAYHFVIGNGIYATNGAISVGERWQSQAPAGGTVQDEIDPRTINICLIGDFSSEPPSPEQLAALDELIHYLRAKLGHLKLRSHSRSGDGRNSCPGRYFPRDTFIDRLNGSSPSLAVTSK